MGTQCVSIITMLLYSPITPQNIHIYIMYMFKSIYFKRTHTCECVCIYILYIIYLVIQNLIHVYNLFYSDPLSIPSLTYLNSPFHHTPANFHIFSLSFFFMFICSLSSFRAVAPCMLLGYALQYGQSVGGHTSEETESTTNRHTAFTSR